MKYQVQVMGKAGIWTPSSSNPKLGTVVDDGWDTRSEAISVICERLMAGDFYFGFRIVEIDPLPSAADLDAVEEETKAKEATGDPQKGVVG